MKYTFLQWYVEWRETNQFKLYFKVPYFHAGTGIDFGGAHLSVLQFCLRPFLMFTKINQKVKGLDLILRSVRIC